MTPGLMPRQRFVAEADRIEVARPEAFDDDVRRRYQALEEASPVGALEVEGDAALAGVEVEPVQAQVGVLVVVRRQRAHRIAAGRLQP